MKDKIRKILIVIFVILLFYLYKEYHEIWLRQIIKTQRKLIPLISHTFKNKDKIWMGVIFLFFYGMVHSIGPGHGKAIILSITISNKLNLKKIIIISAIISYLQGISALFAYKLFILIGVKLIPSLSFNLEENSRKMSAFLLIILGLFFLYKEFKNNNNHLEKKDKQNIFLGSFLIGIIPCSGILNILIFLKLLKLERYTFISITSICTGMFLTLVFSGVFSNFVKYKTLKNKAKIKYIGYISMVIYGLYFLGYIGS